MVAIDPKLEAIFHQATRHKGIPVVLITRKGQPLWLLMPCAEENGPWIAAGHKQWIHQYVKSGAWPHWNIPRTWLKDVTQRIVKQRGCCYLVQGLREQEKCSPACWMASGLLCVCSCMGEHHGEGHPNGRWYVVSETCAVSWGEKKLHYKMITGKAGAETSTE